MCPGGESSCLFCSSNGPFTTVEHTIPAALGNDESILVGHVCDACQNYLGKEVEAFALREPPIGPLRVLLGIRGRRGKLPVVESQAREGKGGRLPSFHPASDAGLTFGADEAEGAWVAIERGDMVKAILQGSKADFRFVLTPKHLAMMGRLLGKMALELLCQSDPEFARLARFDELRRFVRFGVRRDLWVIGHKRVCHLEELKTLVLDGEAFNETVTCYEYSMLEVGAERLFTFMFGGESWVISMDSCMPSEETKAFLANERYLPLWYSREEWSSNRVE